MKVCLALLMAVLMAATLSTAAAPLPYGWAKAATPSLIDMTETIPMVIALRRSNPKELERVFWAVSDPESPSYGEHLGHDEMRRLITPGEKSLEAVKAWLAAAGIKNVEVARHEDSMKFTATRAQVASLLKVKFETYENAKTKQRVHRALGDIAVPAHLADVVELVAGHAGFPLPKQKRPELSNPFNPVRNVTPSLLWEIYNENEFPETPAGQRNIQSFFQAQGQYVREQDLSQFCTELMGSKFTGNCTIAKYIGKDSNSQPGTESELDSQYITATSYGTETWAYSYSGMDFCSDLLTWAQDVFAETEFPYVISMSYGSQQLPVYCLNQGANRLSQDTMKMGTMGISVIIASGDFGSGEYEGGQYNNGKLGTSMPAELPYVTAVGSTTFESGNIGPQRAATFSGGGFSYFSDAPAYQKDAISAFFASNPTLPTSAQYPKSGRGTPDVSVIGEGYYVIMNGQEVKPRVAGTSCSTPAFAGMISRLNNIRLEKNTTLGFLNPLLYKNAGAFIDIVKGDNDAQNDGNGWYAQQGWDPVTGLGNPDFSKLAKVVRALNKGGNNSTPIPATPTTAAPPVPTPVPGAPTTAAPSGKKTFTQKVCQNSACTEGCQSHTFDQDVCLQLNGGGSAKAKCTSENLVLTTYFFSNSCQGFSLPTTEPLNTCEMDTQGSYVENICGSTGAPAAPAGSKLEVTEGTLSTMKKVLKRFK